ncbi:MAG: hypothetical protein KAT34_15200 [Candidatus Aminicenantes bacterium]|nr:hypothetical protein [Candidatus Aminicenantes bacterium]
MPFVSHTANTANYLAVWNYTEETQADDRISNKSGGGIIIIGAGYYFIKTRYGLMDLSTYTADEHISEGRHFAQYEGWTILHHAICLWNLS